MDPRVEQATTRTELYNILGFLDGNHLLPFYCEVHSMVLAALQTSNPCYTVYYVPSRDGKSYLAIVGVKQDTTMDHVTKTRTPSWMLTDWCEDEDILPKVYDSIKAIDWKRDTVFIMGSKSLDPTPSVLEYIRGHHKINEKRLTFYPVYRYNIDILDALALDIKIPQEVYLSSLERRHAGLIHSNWKSHNNSSSVEDLADEIDQFPSVGVFLKETDELVCWLTFHLGFGMARLFTLEPYRRRGYAVLAVQNMSKQMARSGYIPVIAGIVENTASNNLFKTLKSFRLLKPANGFFISSSV